MCTKNTDQFWLVFLALYKHCFGAINAWMTAERLQLCLGNKV